MSELRELYQQVIIDHGRNPRNFGELVHATHTKEGHNPLCGDHLFVFLQEQEGQVVDIKFKGTGCAISMASASLMTLFLKGKTKKEAIILMKKINTALTAEKEPDIEREIFGDLVALFGVRNFPIRVKCATLPWHTFEAALYEKKEVSME